MTTTYNVASEGATFGNTDTTTLNGAIRTIDTGAADNYVINITGDIDLTAQLLALNLPTGSTLTINGGGNTIDGGDTYNGFFCLFRHRHHRESDHRQRPRRRRCRRLGRRRRCRPWRRPVRSGQR